MGVRVTITGLMATVLTVAVGIAALRRQTAHMASASYTLAATTMTIATLGAIILRGRRRAAWVGFALFGWVYLLLSFGSSRNNFQGGVPLIATTRLLHWMFGPFFDPSRGMRDPSGIPFNLTFFTQIGHSIFAILFASVGATLGGIFAAWNERAQHS